MNFAIIPARIGSKRIRNKNIKIFNSKPMLFWVYKELKKSKIFDKIIVTTDSKKISKVAKRVGFKNIIYRPKKLANDYCPIKPVIRNAISQLKINEIADNVCCVFPCNPFLLSQDLKKTFKILKKNTNEFIYPVVKYSHPIQRSFFLKKKNKIFFSKKNLFKKRTQDLKNYYHDSGQFYWGTCKNWMSKKNFIDKAIGYEIPQWRSVDIDNISDWKKAELLFKVLK